MTMHTLAPEVGTVHGSFSRDLPPALTIDPGDTVQVRTLDAAWNIAPRTSSNPDERPPKFTPRDPQRDAGHALCGPIAIRGAEVGMTLAVHLDAIVPGSWGWTSAGGWSSRVNERLGVVDVVEQMHVWQLDRSSMTGTNQFGQVVALHPFMGVLGMPPPEPGWHPTAPPRPWGGNLDCKELVAGSTVYLPIPVTGGLFSVGDGHAAQGDGEVSSTAIECPMDLVQLTFDLLPSQRQTAPWASTPVGWVTMGLHTDLHEAAMLALDAMLELMEEHYGLNRQNALTLASIVVDLHITQLVNAGVLGVHAVLPHHALQLP